MDDIIENMDKDQVFDAIQRKFKDKIRKVNRKNYRIFFKKVEYASKVQGILFEKEIPHVWSDKVIRIAD